MKIFISHSSQDKKFVRMLKDCLLENSIDVWLDEDQLDLGDRLISKLETALNGSSHLVIILSPASVQSEWVKYELKKALDNQRTGLMQKIIPIKYRDCEIPLELTDLLHADLSQEVVLPNQNSDRVRFISNGFDNFFLKLVRSIRNSTKEITSSEKDEIIKAIKSTEKQIDKKVELIHRANYELVGFNTLESRTKYQQKIIVIETKDTLGIDDVRPLLLPSSLKYVLKLELGDPIIIISDLNVKTFGHFAGYRIDDLKITLDKRIRDDAFLISKKIYQVEIDIEQKTIRFVSHFRTVSGLKYFGMDRNLTNSA